MKTAVINTPLGVAQIVGNEEGIAEIKVLDNGLLTPQIPEVLQEAVLQLEQYFEGTRTQFQLVLNPQGTVFQQRVWQALLQIPYGKTVSYAALAHQLGDIKAIRAVAAANGKNPLWIVVPCHRVIGSDGSLTGYAGGLPRKKWLLEHENQEGKQLPLF